MIIAASPTVVSQMAVNATYVPDLSSVPLFAPVKPGGFPVHGLGKTVIQVSLATDSVGRFILLAVSGYQTAQNRCKATINLL